VDYVLFSVIPVFVVIYTVIDHLDISDFILKLFLECRRLEFQTETSLPFPIPVRNKYILKNPFIPHFNESFYYDLFKLTPL
jgi:hypothetical protein